MTPFETWWYHEGSQGPTAGNDLEEHCMRMCKIAWEKSAQAEREACARVAERSESALHCAFAIRARSQP
jgi:hypothetical protein